MNYKLLARIRPIAFGWYTFILVATICVLWNSLAPASWHWLTDGTIRTLVSFIAGYALSSAGRQLMILMHPAYD